MSFIFSSLRRKFDEEQVQFDSRISKMLPILAGRAYFDLRNYDNASGEFNAYVKWDEELMDKLHYRLPSGGYYVKATIRQAYAFHELREGLPVYMKLISREGRIYPYRTYTISFGRPFSIEFNGSMLIPFDDKYESDVFGNSSRSSQHGNVSGSQRYYMNGSQMRYMLGSQRYYMSGSQMRYMLGSQRYYMSGSQMRYMLGSQRYYMLGSQMRYMLGSQRYYMSGSHMSHVPDSRLKVYPDFTEWSEIPPEWQIINNSRRPIEDKGGNARFGYGIDLII